MITVWSRNTNIPPEKVALKVGRFILVFDNPSHEDINIDYPDGQIVDTEGKRMVIYKTWSDRDHIYVKGDVINNPIPLLVAIPLIAGTVGLAGIITIKTLKEVRRTAMVTFPQFILMVALLMKFLEHK